MTSKIEDRLRKNGVKIKKYYKSLRWSMIYDNTINFYKKNYIEEYIDFINAF